MSESIKDLRIKAHLTQSEVADMCHICLRTYQSYENDTSKSNSPVFLFIEKTLRDYLFIDETHGVVPLIDIIDACHTVFSKYEVSYAYLYGSYAKGKMNERSDIDIFIYTKEVGLDIYGMVDELYELLHKKIHLVNQRQFQDNSDFLLGEIIKEGIRVFG